MRFASDRLSIDVAISGPSKRRRRHAIILLLAALLLIVLVAIAAHSGDVGYIRTAETDFERAVDVSRLAGAEKIVDGVEGTACTFVLVNPVGGRLLDEAFSDIAARCPLQS